MSLLDEMDVNGDGQIDYQVGLSLSLSLCLIVIVGNIIGLELGKGEETWTESIFPNFLF